MILLTELAARKVKQNLDRRGKGLGIRIGVKTTGCSGLAYTLEYIDNQFEGSLVFESNGVNVFTDPKSLVYIDGLIMDWKKQGLNEGFDFINPKEKDRCGCGESFRI
jgi:iron-sulfur cluster assembly protein